MAIPDEAMGEYYRLLLGREPPIGAGRTQLSPRDAKRALARELVAWLHSEADAQAAERHFDRVFVERGGARGDRGGARSTAPTACVHLPGLIATRVRHVALGGAAADRPGRRHARRAASSGAGEHDVAVRARPTARCCRSAGGASGACALG